MMDDWGFEKPEVAQALAFKMEKNRKRKERKDINEVYNDLNKVNENIHMISMQEIAVEGDTVAIKREENWISQLEKDLFLQESVYILNDMLQEYKGVKVAADDPVLENEK